MSDVVYLGAEQVILLNAKRFGSTVRELDTVTSSTMRCTATWDGADLYPTLWDKAAALLFGLATTQGFVDGNKRTAWAATETFLALNGEFLEMSPVDAHIYVLAISNKAIEHEQIVEWLVEHRLV